MTKYTIIIERGEDGYLISTVVGLSSCHTQARTFDDLIERTKEAINAYIEAGQPTEPTLEFVGIHILDFGA